MCAVLLHRIQLWCTLTHKIPTAERSERPNSFNGAAKWPTNQTVCTGQIAGTNVCNCVSVSLSETTLDKWLKKEKKIPVMARE